MLPNGTELQMDEIDVTGDTQTALDAEAISLSDTPDAEPSTEGRTTYVIGLAARAAPVYEGSKTTKVSPFPYVDIHGLWNDRLFVSDVRGLGINLINLGPFRAGAAINYGGGRTSSDATRLRGLPDISSALSASGFINLLVQAVRTGSRGRASIRFAIRHRSISSRLL